MTGDTMKSGVVESDRVKIEGRQSLHRRKMSKNAPIVNGAADDSVGYEDENMVIRQVNLAAAYHDHISCTKSVDLCKIPDTKEGRVNLPCETDHIYANCSDKAKSHSMINSSPSKDRNDEKRQLHEMCLLQLELIKHLEEENAAKDKHIQVLKQENELLKVRQERMERRFYLMKKSVKSDESDNVSDVGSVMSDSHSQTSPTVASSSLPVTEVLNPAPHPPMQLVTRYFGRRSKTIPSRALKRRYLGPPKSLPCKKSAVKQSPSTASMSSASESQDEVKPPITTSFSATAIEKMPSSTEHGEELRKNHKKHGRKQKIIPRTEEFLTTDKEYYLPVCYTSGQSFDETENIDVPSWRFQPVSSFYQMEGTENIDDRVFHRRHLKCEQDEKRRKRWDIQRLREQRVAEKLKYKHSGGDKNGEDTLLQRKPETFYPNPNNFEYIEVTDKLPVLAFGQPIPLFQPSEFNLPWKVSDFRETDKTKSNTSGVRVT